jgi:hypothetical protein
MKNRIKEFWTDPSSNQYSASRLLLMVLILVYLPVLLVLDAIGIKFSNWAQFAIVVSSVAGVYWFNSTARVWKENYSSSSISIPTKVMTKEGAEHVQETSRV